MDTVTNRAVERPPEDIAAEGIWRIAVGKSCRECWQSLPEDQKEWWRSYAMEAVRWIGSHQPPRTPGTRLKAEHW